MSLSSLKVYSEDRHVGRYAPARPLRHNSLPYLTYDMSELAISSPSKGYIVKRTLR